MSIANPLFGVTARLINDIQAMAASPLPADVLTVGRHCLLDWFAVVIGGSREPLVGMLIDEAREQGGRPVSTIIANGEKTSPNYAGLINAATADALDFADGNLAMRGHTTPAVIATALALAEARDLSGLRFLTSFIVGIETECRVGMLVNPPHLRKGLHPTGNIAPFGTAATAAWVLDLGAAQWENALGIAGTQAAGLLASGGTMSKPLHSGKAAMSGMLAASLASRDYTGARDILEAPEGFLATQAHGHKEEALLVPRDRFLILGTIFKSHAACQLTHSTIENMNTLKRREGVTPHEIESLELRVPRFFLSVCNIAEPRSALEAKFSLRAVAAMALLGDDTRAIDSYAAERVTRPELVKLRDRIEVVAQDDLSGGMSIAIADLTDGRSVISQTDAYRPRDDLAAQEDILKTKFMSLVVPKLGDAIAEELMSNILTIDRLDSVRPLVLLSQNNSLRLVKSAGANRGEFIG